jgi:acyl carrier protein
MDREATERIARREELLARARKLIIEQLHIRREPSEIDPDCPLFATGLGLDSVDAVELVIGIETEFNIQVPDGPPARRSLRTLNTLVDFVLAHEQEKVHAG